MARAMVQATLPHRKVEGNEFERRNGAFTLTLQAPSKIGLHMDLSLGCCWPG
jgi:hypothetical protein